MATSTGPRWEFNPFSGMDPTRGGKSRPTRPISQRRIHFAPKTRNFMIDILTNSCARPWYVYVETALPAFLNMLLTVAILDVADWGRRAAVASLDADPKSIKKKVGGGHFVKWNLPEAEGTTKTISRFGLQTVLRVTLPLEIIGFAWLLYDQTDKFYYNWGMLLEQQPFCANAPLDGPLSRSGPPSQVLSSPTGQGFGYQVLEQNRAGWFTDPNVAVPRARLISAHCTLKLKRDFSPLAGVRLGMNFNDGPKTTTFLSDAVTIGTEDFQTLIVFGKTSQGNTDPIGIEWFLVGPSSATGMKTNGGHVMIQGRQQ